MRIERIVIENLNSLLGRFEIDLTDRAYSGGLFAIVGPSGAGKTTVLDAVCLALYGKTPRIDSVSPEHDELMNKSAPGCRAEVVFTAGGKRYKSVFAHERAKGAKPFRPARRELLAQAPDGAWQVAAAGVREAEERIKEITGLDYAQFTRSILLAQFRFAEFLQADSTDRAKILEKITDMDIYRRISVAVYRKTEQHRERLKETRSRIDLTPLLGDTQTAALADEAGRLGEAAAAHTALRDALGQCRAAAQQLPELRQSLDRYRRSQQPLAGEREKSAAAFRAASDAEQKQKESQEALAKTIAQVRELDLGARHKADEAARIEKEIASDKAKADELKRALYRVFQQYEPDAPPERYKALYDSDDVSDALRAKAKAALDAAAAAAAGIEAKIGAVLTDRGEAQWRARLEQLKKALPVAEAADALAAAVKNREGLVKRKAELEAEYKALEQPFQGIEDEYEYARLGRCFGEERRRLEDGKPCPLCGALHHPAAGDAMDAGYFDAVKQKLDGAKELRDGIVRRLREAELRVGDADALIAQQQSYVDENKALLAQLGGAREPEVIAGALEDAEKRMLELAGLQSRRVAAAEKVTAMTAQFADVDKNVAIIDNHKRGVRETQAAQRTREQQLAQARGGLKALLAQRRALFGDKETDSEAEAAKKALKAAQDAREEARVRFEQAERALVQNGKDIARTQAEIDALSARLEAGYDAAAADAAALCSVSDDDDVAALFGRFADAAAVMDKRPETLARAAGALAALISGETARLGSVRQILKTDAESRSTVKALEKEESAYRKALEKWEMLNALIGSAGGDKFARMAQSITFDALLRCANQSLKRMSSRYILVRDETGPLKPLELAVIDMDQAGEKRPVSNLSGGESFIVSLALALALSEMSSGAARIDSLFIDEGFASLDEDYLEAALQTLFALGNREGKLIGVISHVEALKNRVDVQIEVRRRSGGCAELTGPGVR